MRLTEKQRRRKLKSLARLYDYPDVPWLLAAHLYTISVPGLCANRADLSCNYHRMVRFNESVGYCPDCNRFTVQSCWVLVGLYD